MSLMESPVADAAAPAFRDQPAVAVVETDRFCPGCGYNLREQAVRREPVTKLLLAQCPECGGFDPVSRDTSVGKLWMAWLVRLLLVGWVAALLMLGWIAAAMIYIFAYEQTWFLFRREWNRGNDTISVAQMDWQDRLGYGLMLLGMFLVGWTLVTLMATLLPHWRRWGYALFAAALTSTATWFAAMDLSWRFRNRPDLWPEVAWTLCISGMVTFGGALLALWLARPAVRLLVRILVPARMRAPLAYLWLVDGKTPVWTGRAT